jgi:cytidylate kinase
LARAIGVDAPSKGPVMIVTIDGPAGAGKSSAAKGLAARLNFEYLDTGAMYRVVTLASLRAGINPADQPALHGLLADMRLNMTPKQILLDGEDVTGLIRTARVTEASAAKFFLMANPEERARRRQNEMAAQGESMTWEALLEAQEARDRRDAARDLAPMVPAADAIFLDNTSLSLDEVIDHMEREVRIRMAEIS